MNSKKNVYSYIDRVNDLVHKKELKKTFYTYLFCISQKKYMVQVLSLRPYIITSSLTTLLTAKILR